MFRHAATLSLAFASLFIASAFAQSPEAPTLTQPPATQAPNDYSKPETWLCRPGRKDDCAVDLTTTIVAADGKLTREPFAADPDAPIDCFYVYPTVSFDSTPNSDMQAGPEEHSVIHQQFARFTSRCRTYAPLYRQITLTALRAMMSGQPLTADLALGYNDVVDAWNYYLKNDNQGRGVVLIGHSQGSGVLTQLIREQIDGKPVQLQLISVLLLGTNIAVPKGKDVGGAFQHLPLCKSPSAIGCVISYVTFREETPPPPSSRFGRVPGENMVAACTNPAALGGGKAELHAYLAAKGRTIAGAGAEPKAWVTPAQPVDTPFVSVPGLLTGECISNDSGTYLSVKVNADPADPRTDEIVGDVIAKGAVLKDWGLHVIDVNVAMGNLLDIVGRQSQTYLTTRK